MTEEEEKALLDQRIENIKKLFIRLRDAHNWCQKHFPEDLNQLSIETDKAEEKDRKFLIDVLLPKVDETYKELEVLGVSRDFSEALFIMGGRMVKSLWNQFRDDKRGESSPKREVVEAKGGERG